MALVSSFDIFSKDLGMKIWISKCTNVIVHRGKFAYIEGIPTSRSRIADVETGKGYKYFWVLQTNVNVQYKIMNESKLTYI